MKKDLKKGQWLFTCSMKPQQFGEYTPRNPDDYNDTEKISEWCKYDDFLTLNGSSHSQGNCGCSLISEKYAKWFLENEINSLYNPDDADEVKWDNYEERVKKRCKEDNIEYEGI